MAEITVPDKSLIVDKVWELDSPAQVNRSGWTGRGKTVGLPGAELWSFSARVRFRSTIADQRPWRAFFTSLKGLQNTFKFHLECQRHIGPAPQVDTGAGDGYTLPLKGMSASTILLVAGQCMTVPLPSGHMRLVCLADDLITDAAGKAVANFTPALGEVPALNAVVETANPYSPVMLTTRKFSSGGGSFAFDAVEAL